MDQFPKGNKRVAEADNTSVLSSPDSAHSTHDPSVHSRFARAGFEKNVCYFKFVSVVLMAISFRESDKWIRYGLGLVTKDSTSEEIGGGGLRAVVWSRSRRGRSEKRTSFHERACGHRSRPVTICRENESQRSVRPAFSTVIVALLESIQDIDIQE
jgi:hypothetical protein